MEIWRGVDAGRSGFECVPSRVMSFRQLYGWGKGSMNLEGRLLGGGKVVDGRIKRGG